MNNKDRWQQYQEASKKAQEDALRDRLKREKREKWGCGIQLALTVVLVIGCIWATFVEKPRIDIQHAKEKEAFMEKCTKSYPDWQCELYYQQGAR
jgi:hypothetical protein